MSTTESFKRDQDVIDGASKINNSCRYCMHCEYDKKCKLADEFIPDEVYAIGCELFDDDIPF